MRDSDEPFRYGTVLERNSQLHSATRRVYGSWRKALKVIGITPDGAGELAWKWNQSTVLETLRREWKSSHDIRVHSLRRKYPGIYKAAQKGFGIWTEALAAAGLPSYLRKDKMAARRAYLRSNHCS